MKLSAKNKKILTDEFKFVVERMEEEKAPAKKLYYFSAVHGVLPRVFNVEFNPELVLMHLVLSATHSTLNDRLMSIKRGEEEVIEIPEAVFEQLTKATRELLLRLEQSRTTYEVLQKFANIAYMTTGNGYYLYQKGVLRLNQEESQ